MKVGQIRHFSGKVNYNLNNLSQVSGMPQNAGMGYAGEISNNNGSYGKAHVAMNNTPSFGSGMLGLLLIFLPSIIVAGLDIADIIKTKYDTKVAQKQRKLEDARIKAQYEKDVIKLANTLDISPKKAEKIQEKFLAASYIPPRGKAMQEIGLNAVMGYSMEKYQLMKDVLSPIAISQKAFYKAKSEKDKSLVKKAQEEVPNGVLFYGPPGTGKTYIAHKLGEHAKKLGADFEELVIFDMPTENREEILKEKFEKAEEKFKETGKYSMFLINDQGSYLTEKSDVCNLLLNNMENANQRGLIFVVAVNKGKEINPAFLREGRLEYRMPITKMEKFEVADMINYALHFFEVPQNQRDKFDIQKVADAVKENNWDFTPAEYLGFVKKMNKDMMVTDEEMIERMKKLTDVDSPEYDFWALNPETIELYNKEQEYVKSLTPERKVKEEDNQEADNESIV